MQILELKNFSQAGAAEANEPPIVGNRVELQLLTTLRCNLKCTYCSLGVGEVLGSQRNVTYTMAELDAFIAKHLAGYETYVTFYGGEPTLNLEFMAQVMERYPAFRFQLQTNGTLLDRLPGSILSNLSNILVSIDGGEGTTDTHRGRGIYRQVMKHLDAIRGRLGGVATARVTWSSEDTSFEEIDGLTRHFDYVYFQFAQKDDIYHPEALAKKRGVLTQLVEKFFASERLYPVIPLMGVVRNKVLPSRAQELYAGLSQCRVSTHILNVMPDGKIYPCPDMLYLPQMQQGDVVGNWLRRSPLQPHPDMPCQSCDAFAFCRRNCMKNLYRAYVQGDEAYRRQVVEPVCDLVRFLGEEVDRHDPHRWYARAPLALRKALADCEVYEYVEIMP
ncbi:MAG: radical SAM protein [Betaproteobacteria bacterium]|nr:radical SAM protein [Betaproteobacteria bacterium]